jgi:hypothetical protein
MPKMLRKNQGASLRAFVLSRRSRLKNSLGHKTHKTIYF